MLTNFIVVASQVVTLFLLMGVGFVLAQLGKLTDEGVSQMSFLVLYVVSPCAVIRAFEIELTPGLLLRLVQFALLYMLCYGVCIVFAALSFRNQGLDQRASLRFSMVYGNGGFMGFPLLRSILGASSLIFGAVSLVLFNLLMWTHGVKTMGGKVTARQALVNPATVALAIALPLLLTGWRPPEMVDNAIGFLADLNTPLAMVVIGAQMAGADLKVSFTSPRLYAVTAFRLILSPLICLVLLLPLRGDPLLYCSCVILCAVPTAGATGMLAQRFGRDTATAAQMVTLSTLLSVLTLPLFAVAAQAITGLI